MRRLASFLLAAALVFPAVSVYARANDTAPADKSSVLLVCDEANGRARLEELIRTCGKSVDSVSEAEYRTSMLDGRSCLITTITRAYSDAISKGIPVLCLGENAGPISGTETTFLESNRITLNLDSHTQSLFVKSALFAKYPSEGLKTYGSITLANGEVFPFGVIGTDTAYVPWYPNGGLGIVMLGGLMRQFFGESVGQDGRMYVLIDEIYPFSDLDMLVKTAYTFHNNGIPFIVRIMPVYDNLSYPAFNRYTQVLLYVQSLGGSIVLHDPIVQENESLRESLSDKMQRLQEALRSAGIILLPSENEPLSLSLNDISDIQSLTVNFGTMPIDTMISMTLFDSDESLNSAQNRLNQLWLSLSSYKEKYMVSDTVYKKTVIDSDYQYRVKPLVSLKGFFSKANLVMLIAIGILLFIFMLMLIAGNRIYKKKFYKK